MKIMYYFYFPCFDYFTILNVISCHANFNRLNIISSPYIAYQPVLALAEQTGFISLLKKNLYISYEIFQNFLPMVMNR